MEIGIVTAKLPITNCLKYKMVVSSHLYAVSIGGMEDEIKVPTLKLAQYTGNTVKAFQTSMESNTAILLSCLNMANKAKPMAVLKPGVGKIAISVPIA